MNSSHDKKTVRQVIAILLSVFLVWLIYFGSYLPLQKSKQFIITLQSMGEMRSVAEVEQAFAVPFGIPSPIGHEEIVRHFSSLILSTVQRFSPEQASATVELVNHAVESFRPNLDRQRGMSFNQNLYVLGSLNQVAFLQTKDAKYLEESKKYYLLGHELSPKRPQFLYGLFDLYRIEGDVEKTTEVTNQILSLWPNDERTKKLFGEFLTSKGISTTTKKTN